MGDSVALRVKYSTSDAVACWFWRWETGRLFSIRVLGGLSGCALCLLLRMGLLSENG